MRRVMCVWFPRWPVQRRCVQQPALKNRPLVLFGETSRGRFVTACSLEAARYGVRLGQPLAEVQACLSRCASRIELMPADVLGDREQLCRLAGAAQQFTPLTGPEDSPAPSALFLDITGCAPLFGGEPALCQSIHRWLTESGYQVRWALADTVGAAWACARFGRQSMIVPPNKHAALLQRFPLAALRLSGNVANSLRSLGVQTIGDLSRLPRASLPGRFGPELLRRWDQALGALPETFAVERLQEPLAAQREFEEPLTQRFAVDAVSDAVLETLLASPRLLAAGLQELRGRFRLEESELTIALRLIEPTRDLRHLGQLARLQLDRLVWAGGIVQVRWEVVQAGPLPIQQCELFANDSPESSPRALLHLVDRLSARLGRERVSGVRVVPDPQPEFAVACEPWQPAVEQHHSRGAVPACCRPTRLLQPPQPLQVWSVVPDGPPFRVKWKGQRHDIARAWGPERIETGWWRAPDVQRDYYRVEISGGAQWWLFRDRAAGGWFLHGFFD